ncbi:Rxt3-domain-containing protein [Xylariaceae sp. FL0016]|nr:Rxt3-domain-containing protein [Xylariaceae sp. FL0016]
MDPRQPPQLPFSRNNASSPQYTRSPFTPAPNGSNNPPTSSPYPPHPPHPAASTSPAMPYADHQRRPSDTNPFYPQPHSQQSRPPPYGQEPTSHPAQSHSRHQSSSSLQRGMPPPPSPPQHPAQPPQPHQMGHYGGGPPGPRPPLVGSLGPPSAFPSARELPALNSIARTGSTNSNMSIASMLGGPPPAATREPTPSHAGSYAPPVTSAAVSGPTYAGSVHASPRMQNANEYGAFNRRPQTPDQGRPFDARDPRNGSATSPARSGVYGTPEVMRYGTPQAYPARGPGLPPDDMRDHPNRISAASVPPRPSSQPRSYHGMAPRSADMGRGPSGDMARGPPPPGDPMYGRREDGRSGPVEYFPDRAPPRGMPFEEQRRLLTEREVREQMQREAEFRERAEFERRRYEEQRPYLSERERFERERAERDRMEIEREMREAEMRERAQRERTTSDPTRAPGQHPADFGPQGPPRQPPPYGRPDPRDPTWQQRPGYEQPPPPRDAYGQPYPGQRPGDYPVTAGVPYGAHPAYAQPPQERFPTTGPPLPHATQASQPGPPPPPPGHPFESPDRHRFVQAHPQQQQQQQQHLAPHRARAGDEGPPPPSVAYNGGPGAAAYEVGRARPMDEGMPHGGPQRGLLGVQEINRKGRVSPLPQAVQGAQPLLQGPAGEPGIKSEFGRMFSGIGSGVRGIGVSSPVPSGAQIPFSNNPGLGRRDEPDPPGHETVVEAPAKAPRKRRKPKEEDSRGDDDSNGRATPVGRAKRAKTLAHHHQSNPAPSKPGQTIIPKPKQKISSKAVLDSVADRPRKHLGDVVYAASLKPAKLESSSRFGFSSNPRPLPMDRIKNNENSTLTVKVPRVNLSPSAREEITSRRAVWGTDVYTDDSDVVAACIHAGWIRGEWGDDVDTDLLNLHKPITKSKRQSMPVDQHRELLTSVPVSGPVHVPSDRDLHVTVLILPALEKYASSTRFGITSREFGGVYNGRKSSHDGISFMIQSVRWVDGAAPQSRLRGKARRERIRQAMSEMNRSQLLDIGEKEVPGKPEKVSVKTKSGTSLAGRGEGDKENHPVHARDAKKPSSERENGKVSGEEHRVREQSGDAEGARHDTATADAGDSDSTAKMKKEGSDQ